MFVTAYDQYAIEAFEVNAVDYLLKPVEPGRLSTTVDRVRQRLQPTGAAKHRSTGNDLDRSVELRRWSAGPPRAAGDQGRGPVPARPG